MRTGVLFLVMFGSSLSIAMERDEKWDAQLYDEHSKPQYTLSLDALDQIELSKPQFKTIVELGCNTANVANTLAQRYPEKMVVGIDPQESLITLGRTKHADTQNLTLIHDSAQKYNLEKCNLPRADFVACYHVLHWIARDELQAVFRNITENLNEDGVLDILTSAKQENTPLAKAILWTLVLSPSLWCSVLASPRGVLKGQDLLSLLSQPEVEELATQAGLVVDACEEVESVARFESRAEFCLWLSLILQPYDLGRLLSVDVLAKFVSDVAQLYCTSYNPGQEGRIEYSFKTLHLRAHKPGSV